MSEPIEIKEESMSDSNIHSNETVDTTKTTNTDLSSDNTALEVDKEKKGGVEETTTTSTNKESSSSDNIHNSSGDSIQHQLTPIAEPNNNPSTSDIHEHATPSSKYTSVKDIGVSSEKNARFRRTMEDEHVFLDKFGDVQDQGYFAIYDGHGGRGAVDFTSKVLHVNLLEELNKNPNGDILESIKKSYLDTDEQMANEPIQFSGTTTISALIRVNEKGERHLYVANAGDARAVICKNQVAERLSYDHKGSDQEETKRIIDAGGFVVNNRVNGILAVTRSLGDHSMKEYVIGDPYRRTLQLDDSYTHLILACDGLWDVVHDQEAVDFILKDCTSAQQMSDKLLVAALKKGSTDNISIMVIIL